MNRSMYADRAVYTILRLSVLLSLIIIVVGVANLFYQLQGSLSSEGLVFRGVSLGNLVRMMLKGDPAGILGLSAIMLILGVILSITATLAISVRVKDKSLAIVSALLLMLLLLSVSVGLLVKITLSPP